MSENKQPIDQKEKDHQQAKDEATKAPESKESIMAKQIIDLQTEVESLKKTISEREEEIKKLEKKIADDTIQYKDSLIQVEERANKLVQQKSNENEAKAKAELDEAKKYAIKDSALKLIAIIDDLERACNFPAPDPKVKSFLVGCKMILTKFNNLLADLHISIIEPKVGEGFNPATMACFEETVQDPSKVNDTIVEVLEKGYMLHKHILKPALVKVVKNS